ncbi:MAG TPA: hypothetical protein VHC86_04665 [Opitutaceae bacterium]|nr:hypothetical protein [Opitutaceae bacterium]
MAEKDAPRQALAAYDRAWEVLAPLPADAEPLFRRRRTLARLNRAGILMVEANPALLADALASLESALAEMLGHSGDEGALPLLISLRATQARALAQQGGWPGAIEAAEEGLALARRSSGDPLVGGLIGGLFQFCAEAYARHQPHFVPEFLDEALPLADAAGPAGAARLVADRALRHALGRMAHRSFEARGTPDAEVALARFSQLRRYAERRSPLGAGAED